MGAYNGYKFESRPYVLDMAIFMEEIDRQIFHRDREEARG